MCRRIFVCFVVAVLAACGGADSDQPTADAVSGEKGSSPMAEVTGTVGYRERMALSPEAVVSVQLLDVSRADAAAITVGEQTIESPGQAPVAFAITYDPDAIDERNSYAVRAEILDRGQLIFTTDRHYPVITRGAMNEVSLVLLRTGGKAEESTGPGGTRWRLTALGERPVAAEPEGKEIHINIDSRAGQAGGHSGCNNFTGSVVIDGEQISFGPLAVTSMACAEGMDQEQAFLQALSVVNRYEMESGALRFFDGEALLASFEAANVD